MKRAVAYIRVSSKSDAQLHSYDYQENYWKNKIDDTGEYKLEKVYADFGISGRTIMKRPSLMELLEDAKEKKFDVVYTKSISRLSRNTIDLITIVRTLRDLGIRIFFENENIDTFDPTYELLLTIAASVAENDLKTYSDNQRWSFHERFKKGYVSVGNGIYGYKMNNEINTLEIVPDEAQIVKKIFELYISGLGIAQIVLKLNSEKCGKENWNRSGVRYILKNEKYKGDCLSQKVIKKQGVSILNKGEAKQYYTENTHEGIVSKEDFNKVQELMKQRACAKQIGREPIPPYPFTKKLECGVCGHGYTHKFNNCNKAWRNAIWSCNYQNNYSKKVCDNTRIKDDVLKEKFVEAFNEFIITKPLVDEVQDLKDKLAKLVNDETELKALRINHLIEVNDYNKEFETIKEEIEKLRSKLFKYDIRKTEKEDYEPITTFSEDKVDKFLVKTVVDHHKVIFKFINGVEITKTYSNGPSGNQKGWKAKREVK